MSKIVQALNVMITNPAKFKKVRRKPNGELFFEYKGFSWSIWKAEDDDYLLWFYPEVKDIDSIVQLSVKPWGDLPMVRYSADEIGTREAKATFSELYNMLTERFYGVNAALDEILKDETF